MPNSRKLKEGVYRDKYEQIYCVLKNNGAYQVKNQEGRIIKIDDLESFMKEVKKVNRLENLSE